MTPAGYMAKRVEKSKGFEIEGVTDVYSVGACVNDDFADYIEFWKHNKFWLFDSPSVIESVARENAIDLKGTALFYYEAHEREFDGETWKSYKTEESFPTNVNPPITKSLEGYDVVTFYCGSAPEHSPALVQRPCKKDPHKYTLPLGVVGRSICESGDWTVQAM